MLNLIPALILLIAQGCSPAESRTDFSLRASLAARQGASRGVVGTAPDGGPRGVGGIDQGKTARGLEMWRLVLLVAWTEPFISEAAQAEPIGAAQPSPSTPTWEEPRVGSPTDGFTLAGRTRDGPSR